MTQVVADRLLGRDFERKFGLECYIEAQLHLRRTWEITYGNEIDINCYLSSLWNYYALLYGYYPDAK